MSVKRHKTRCQVPGCDLPLLLGPHLEENGNRNTNERLENALARKVIRRRKTQCSGSLRNVTKTVLKRKTKRRTAPLEAVHHQRGQLPEKKKRLCARAKTHARIASHLLSAANRCDYDKGGMDGLCIADLHLIRCGLSKLSASTQYNRF